MTMLWVNEAIERLPALGYRTRITVCAAAAAGIPVLLVLSQGQIGPAIAAGAGALWFLLCVHRLLLPLRDLARALDACVEAAPAQGSEATPEGDEMERMMTNADRISELLQAAMNRELSAMIARTSPDSAAPGEMSEQNPRRAATNSRG